MQTLDPITLAIIAVVVAVLLSALLLLLFVTREERFEDVVAAQRAETEANAARATSTKPVKQRKKIGKSKKKNLENEEMLEEVLTPSVEEIVEASATNANVDEESFPLKDFQDVMKEEKPSIVEEPPSSVGVKERQGKKKSKKVVLKDEESAVTGRQAHFEKPREVVEEMVKVETIDVVEMAVPPQENNSEVISVTSDELKPQEQLPPTREAVPSAKKVKSKTKSVKDKSSIEGKVNSRVVYSFERFSIFFQYFPWLSFKRDQKLTNTSLFVSCGGWTEVKNK